MFACCNPDVRIYQGNWVSGRGGKVDQSNIPATASLPRLLFTEELGATAPHVDQSLDSGDAWLKCPLLRGSRVSLTQTIHSPLLLIALHFFVSDCVACARFGRALYFFLAVVAIVLLALHGSSASLAAPTKCRRCAEREGQLPPGAHPAPSIIAAVAATTTLTCEVTWY